MNVRVSEDHVIAAAPLELAQADLHAGDFAGTGESHGIECVGEVASDDPLDRGQRVNADTVAGDRAGSQVDGDAAGGIGVDRPVEAGAAIKLVVAAEALEPVVLAKTKDRIRQAGPDQRIPRRRADDAVREYEVAGDKRSLGDILQCKGIAIAEIDDRVGALLGGARLDVRQAENADHIRHVDPVALTVAEVRDDISPAAGGVDKNVRCRAAGQAVVAAAPVNPVASTARADDVVAEAADQNVGDAVSRERIVECGSGQVLEPGQRISAGSDRVLRGRLCQVDRNAGRGIRVRCRVVAAAAGKNVIAAVAFQDVVLARPGQVLDVDQRIALGVAANAQSRREADIHPRSRRCVSGGVGSCVAVEGVSPSKARKCVVAAVADHDVAGGIAGRTDIPCPGQGQVLDIGAESVADRRSNRVGSLIRGFRHLIAGTVDDVGIVTRAADQRVRTCAAVQRVVALEADDDICLGRAGQDVVEMRAGEIFERAQRIAAGTDGVLRGRQRQADRDAGRSMLVRYRVVAAAAGENIVAVVAFQHVVVS